MSQLIVLLYIQFSMTVVSPFIFDICFVDRSSQASTLMFVRLSGTSEN